MTIGHIPGGLLIAVEGIDGAGKTTVAHALAERLRVHGATVTVGKEPTAGPWGAQLRATAAQGRLSVEEEMRLLLLDRRQHVDEVIKPALERGEVVMLDRYYPSSAAYQGARGIPVEEILQHNAFAPAPDVTLLLDLAPATGLARIRARGDKPNHFETEDNLALCREVFLTMALPSRVIVDATRGADEVLESAWQAIGNTLSVKLDRAGGTQAQSAETLR
ncbi:dTMP kinase [Dyella acidiphila]|uniref:Thymidylate kinase n=1 Tax=Dyella acidiphila TaxID=2775866 RepID=A0ABR9G8V5_9GAMM|nr:dTMP kinase [Dyella acidiphila]